MLPQPIGELFLEEPPHWGLRGDPYLWREMRDHFAKVTLPSSAALLVVQLEETFLLLSGHDICSTNQIYRW